MSEPRIVSGRDLMPALAALADGEVVAIPTDTVYGLAARLDRPEAVAAIFALKDRPPGLALPVLVGDWKQAHSLVLDWPPPAAQLAARFWPGPLTVVVPVPPELGSRLGGDGRSAGLRQPRHRIVRALCQRAGPLAVTSANRHGDPPGTDARQVAALFAENDLALVVDGGVCDGAPSTVVDCTAAELRCIREGALPWEWVVAAAEMDERERYRRRLFGLLPPARRSGST